YAATELRAARALLDNTRAAVAAGRGGEELESIAVAFAAETAHRLRSQVQAAPEDFGVDDDSLAVELGSTEALAAIRSGMDEARLRAIGRRTIDTRGLNRIWLDDEAAEMTRDHVRGFAKSEVAPLAERVHRHDELVPD